MAHGCATTPSDPTKFGEPVAGWPALTVVEHHLSDDEMRAACEPVMPAGVEPAGCAYVHLDSRICDVYFGSSSTASETIVRSHELKHCAGRDHLGDSSLSDLWRQWQAWNNAVAHARRQPGARRN